MSGCCISKGGRGQRVILWGAQPFYEVEYFHRWIVFFQTLKLISQAKNTNLNAKGQFKDKNTQSLKKLSSL